MNPVIPLFMLMWFVFGIIVGVAVERDNNKSGNDRV